MSFIEKQWADIKGNTKYGLLIVVLLGAWAVLTEIWAKLSFWNLIQAMCLFLSGWVVVVILVLQRRRSRVEVPGSDAWNDDAKLEKIYNRTFKNETVVLDGRHFINPVFDSVTLFYQGTGGVFLENPTYVLSDGKSLTRLATRNKVVGMTLKIHNNLLRAANVQTETVNLGPEAPFDMPRISGTPTINKWDPSQFEEIADKTFTNESIEVDGKRFKRCVFDNATLLYRGLGGVDFVDVKIADGKSLIFKCLHPAVRVFNELTTFISSIHQGESSFGVIDEQGKWKTLIALPTGGGLPPVEPTQPKLNASSVAASSLPDSEHESSGDIPRKADNRNE